MGTIQDLINIREGDQLNVGGHQMICQTLVSGRRGTSTARWLFVTQHLYTLRDGTQSNLMTMSIDDLLSRIIQVGRYRPTDRRV